MTNTFRLRFLGPITIEQDKEPVSGFRSRKALALLAYLAIQDQPVPRERLADLFWQDLPESRGRANLSWVLHKLSSLLPDCLQADRHTIWFERSDRYWLDLDAFDELAAKQEVDARAAAAELYRGEFLEGLYLQDCLEFEIWLVRERERWRQQVTHLLEEVIAYHERRGEYEPSLRFARRLLDLEPWREETHRLMMRLLAQNGQHSAALARYESCRRVLAEELDVEPSLQTRSLHERIQAASLAQGHNLPPQPTPFVGRKEEIRQAARLLSDPDCRLLTVIGPGGIGKSRLALQVAEAKRHAFLEGVYFVPLAPLRSADFLASAIAQGLGFPLSGRGEAQTQLLDYLRGKQALLVLDSFERLLAGAEFLGEILRQAPEVKLLVTSRERLCLSWEWRFQIEGLEHPQDEPAVGEGLRDYDAVRLFHQTAQRASQSFSPTAQDDRAIVRICRLVEGMPLGIELAAAWTGSRTCGEIGREIEHNLSFLATSLRDVPERHRSIRATFEYSWQSLTPTEQDTLARLSVFKGGVTPEAAQEVVQASPTILQSLVDKSLVRFLPAGRYDVHELLRQYGQEKLADLAQARLVRDRHSQYFATFLQEQEGDLKSERVSQAVAAIKGEIENVRAAWRWAVAQSKLAEIERGLGGLAHFYRLVGPFQEAEKLFAPAADRLRAITEAGEDEGGLLGKLLVAQAEFLQSQGRFEPAASLAQSVIGLARAHQMPDLEAEGHLKQGQGLSAQGQWKAARSSFEQAITLARSTSQPRVQAMGLSRLGFILTILGDHAGAKAHHKQALDLCRQAGDRGVEGRVLNNLGSLAYEQGDYVGAQAYYEQALGVAREIGNRLGECITLGNLALAHSRQGNYAPVSAYYQQALVTCRQIGSRAIESSHLNNLGNALFDQGEYAQAVRYLEQALHISDEIGQQEFVLLALNSLALVSIYRGDYAQAEAYCERALQSSREGATPRIESMALSSRSLLATRRGDPQAGLEYGQQALRVMQKMDEYRRQAYVLFRLGLALENLGRLDEAGERYRQALALRRGAKQHHLAVEPLAGLARLALAQGDLTQAQAQAEEILDHLETHTPTGVDEPFQLYLTCYRVLEAAQDPRAPDVLQAAHRLLQERATKAGNEDMRRSFLENVPAHRELVAAFQNQRG